MNRDLYTDEFRSFKHLQLSPEFAAYYKMVGNLVNSIQPGPLANDPTFVWPFRVEFVDQLLDLANDTLYIVNTTAIEESNNFYESANLLEFKNPYVFEGNIFLPDLGKPVTIDDIKRIENGWTDIYFWLIPINGRKFDVSKEALNAASENTIDVSTLPVVPKKNIGYTAMFANKDVAEHYQQAVTQALRNKKAAVSAISRYF